MRIYIQGWLNDCYVIPETRSWIYNFLLKILSSACLVIVMHIRFRKLSLQCFYYGQSSLCCLAIIYINADRSLIWSCKMTRYKTFCYDEDLFTYYYVYLHDFLNMWSICYFSVTYRHAIPWPDTIRRKWSLCQYQLYKENVGHWAHFQWVSTPVTTNRKSGLNGPILCQENVSTICIKWEYLYCNRYTVIRNYRNIAKHTNVVVSWNID